MRLSEDWRAGERRWRVVGAGSAGAGRPGASRTFDARSGARYARAMRAAADGLLSSLLTEIRACRLCEPSLPLGARPVLVADPRASILLAGQAPGTKVHASGVPWDDASGRRLREWLSVTPAEFYDASRFAIVPMGFCYPGRGASGDLPPRPECRETWHPRLFPLLPGLRVRLLIGHYAQSWHLGDQARSTLTETVAAWRDHGPDTFPLPHPSPRNQRWFIKNPWFSAELIPELRKAVRAAM